MNTFRDVESFTKTHLLLSNWNWQNTRVFSYCAIASEYPCTYTIYFWYFILKEKKGVKKFGKGGSIPACSIVFRSNPSCFLPFSGSFPLLICKRPCCPNSLFPFHFLPLQPAQQPWHKAISLLTYAHDCQQCMAARTYLVSSNVLQHDTFLQHAFTGGMHNFLYRGHQILLDCEQPKHRILILS